MIDRKFFILSTVVSSFLLASTLSGLPLDEDWDVEDEDGCCCCDEDNDEDWYQYYIDEGWPGRREDTWFDSLER